MLTPIGAAAPVLSDEPELVASSPLPPDVRLAVPLPLGVPVALDVWFPEQKIWLGFTPLSIKQD